MTNSRGGGSLSEDTKVHLLVLFKRSQVPEALAVPIPKARGFRSISHSSIDSSIQEPEDDESMEAEFGINSEQEDPSATGASKTSIPLNSLDDLSRITAGDYENLSPPAAMKIFLVLLFNAAPYWKYYQFLEN